MSHCSVESKEGAGTEPGLPAISTDEQFPVERLHEQGMGRGVLFENVPCRKRENDDTDIRMCEGGGVT